MFVRQQDVEAVRTMVDNYKKLRSLTMEQALATLDAVKQDGVASALEQSGSSCRDSTHNQGSWKEKCRQKSKQIKAGEIKIRDLMKSRDKWREECLELRKQVKADGKTTRTAQGSSNNESREKK
jgi:hypothetical protein